MKTKDVIIATWQYGKDNFSFSLAELETELLKQKFSKDEILYSQAFVEKYFDGTSNGGFWSIDPASYVSLINYKSVRFAKHSYTTAIVSIIVAIITLLSSIIIEVTPIGDHLKEYFNKQNQNKLESKY